MLLRFPWLGKLVVAFVQNPNAPLLLHPVYKFLEPVRTGGRIRGKTNKQRKKVF